MAYQRFYGVWVMRSMTMDDARMMGELFNPCVDGDLVYENKSYKKCAEWLENNYPNHVADIRSFDSP